MRILLVSSAAQTSKTGVTAHYNRLLTELAGRVDSVELITPVNTPRLLKKLLGAFRRVAALTGQNGRVIFLELENFISVWAAVRRRGGNAFDLIHAQDATSGAAAASALGYTVKVVVTCHFNDDPLSEYNERYSLNDWTNKQLAKWYQFLFRQLDAFIMVSRYTKQAAAFLCPEQTPCIVIHNGVVFPQLTDRRVEEPFTILNIGTVEERKNQRLLIDAAEEMRNRGFTQFRVWLLGDGPRRADWQRLVEQRGLEKHVLFLGYQPNVTDYLKRASVYVHTARNESWGYTVTEAIAAGTPVLALAAGGIPEQFDAYKPGLLPGSTDGTQLADAILRCRVPEVGVQMANRQMAYARSRFRLDIMIDKHLDFYRVLIGRSENAYTRELVANV